MSTSPVATSVKLSGAAAVVEAEAEVEVEAGVEVVVLAAGGGAWLQAARRTTASSPVGQRSTRATLEQDGVPDGDPAGAPDVGVDAEAVLRRPGHREHRLPHAQLAAAPLPLVPVEGEDEVGARVVGRAPLGHLACRGLLDRAAGHQVDR